jgi:hypothetical protein
MASKLAESGHAVVQQIQETAIRLGSPGATEEHRIQMNLRLPMAPELPSGILAIRSTTDRCTEK